MPVKALVLAADHHGEWRLVFDADELDLYFQFSAQGAAPDPADHMSVDDFLAWTPKERLHREALAAFVVAVTGVFN